MDEIDWLEQDWLQQQDLATWRARIRQLRWELNEERTKPQQLQSAAQETALPSSSQQPQKPPGRRF